VISSMFSWTSWSCCSTWTLSEIDVDRSISLSSTASWACQFFSRAWRSTNCAVTSLPETRSDSTRPSPRRSASAASNCSAGTRMTTDPLCRRLPLVCEEATYPPCRPATSVACWNTSAKVPVFTRSDRSAFLTTFGWSTGTSTVPANAWPRCWSGALLGPAATPAAPLPKRVALGAEAVVRAELHAAVKSPRPIASTIEPTNALRPDMAPPPVSLVVRVGRGGRSERSPVSSGERPAL
jgi:hypothetical protein